MRLGYKQTDVGVIPEDWEVKSVIDLGEVKGGKRLPLGKSLRGLATLISATKLIDNQTTVW